MLQKTFLSTGEDGVVMLFDIRVKPTGPVSKMMVAEGRRKPVRVIHICILRAPPPPNLCQGVLASETATCSFHL